MALSANDGHYTVIYPHSDSWKFDLACPVEGYREQWRNSVLNCGMHLEGDKLAGYLYALRVLVNSALPPAYARSLPVHRFQEQLHHTLYELESKTANKK